MTLGGDLQSTFWFSGNLMRGLAASPLSTEVRAEGSHWSQKLRPCSVGSVCSPWPCFYINLFRCIVLWWADFFLRVDLVSYLVRSACCDPIWSMYVHTWFDTFHFVKCFPLCSSAANELFFSENPLMIVRGEGTYLFDEKNNRYLDCINNVCHGTWIPHAKSESSDPHHPLLF